MVGVSIEADSYCSELLAILPASCYRTFSECSSVQETHQLSSSPLGHTGRAQLRHFFSRSIYPKSYIDIVVLALYFQLLAFTW